MNQTFECVEKYLYRRQYQIAGGDWSTRFYAIFVCHDGKRRTFPAGDNLSDARDELGRLRTLNKGRYDWDAEKKKVEEQKRRAITFSQWGNRYFTEQLSPKPLRPNSIDREKRSFVLLDNFFGDLPLADISRARILEYQKKRAVDGGGPITINREISFLRKLLNVAVTQDPPLIEHLPRFKGLLADETSRARTGTIDAEDFAAILGHMNRPAQRYLIALYETGMRLGEPRKITWSKVDLKAGLIRLAADDVKEKFPRRTPISWELRQVLEELQDEQRRVPNVGGYVLTQKNGRPIKSIRTAFEKARHAANLDRVILHDLRRSTISAGQTSGSRVTS